MAARQRRATLAPRWRTPAPNVYHGQEILKAGIIPAEAVLQNSQYRPEMVGLEVPGGIYAHVAGIDLVKDADGE